MHQLFASSPKALSHKSLRSVSDTKAGHVAYTLSCYAKRVGRYGHLAERRHNGGANNLGAGHDEMLEAHGQRDLGRADQTRHARAERAALIAEAQRRRAAEQIPEKERGHYNLSRGCTESCSTDTKTGSGHGEIHAKE